MNNPLSVNAEEITTKRDALALLKALEKTTDEADIIIRYARRELALAKDIARRKAGKAAALYLPTVPDALAPKLRKVVGALASVARPDEEPKPAPAKPAKPAPAKPAAAKPAAKGV